MQTLYSLFKDNIRQYGMVIALVLITGLFWILTDGINFTSLNLTNSILQTGFILVVAGGMVLVIITGSIDLSVGSVVAVIGAIAGVLIINMGVPVWIAVILSLLAGALIGVWQGFWVAYVGVPSFIVTLGGMLIFRGLTLWLLDGKSLAPFPESFQKISGGFIPNIGGGEVHLLTIGLAILLSIALVWIELKKRSQQVQHHLEVLPLWVSIVKLAILIGVINFFMYKLALYKGLPTV